MLDTQQKLVGPIELISAFFLLLIAVIIITAILYYNRRQSHRIDLSNFQNILLKTQLEVQEQTLTNISRELHDNVTQVLSFVKLNLALTTSSEAGQQEKIKESRDLVGRAIDDLRNLSKSLNYESISAIGLVKSLEIESKRLNNSGLIHVDLDVKGDKYSLGQQRELILFRIFQEALNNTLKYAEAQHFKISLQYSNQLFNLNLEDDGNGFSIEHNQEKLGLGLRNIKSRAALIGADIRIESSPGKGCQISIVLNPILQLTYPDEHDPNSAR